MRVAIAVHGTRGDVEPAAAVARELVLRGHAVRFGAPPDQLGLVAAAGLGTAVPYGPDGGRQMESEVVRRWHQVRDPRTVLRQGRELLMEGWAEMGATLRDLAADADLVLTGTTYAEVAANVAEALGLPFATLQYFPARANDRILPIRLPMAVVTPLWASMEWVHWRLSQPASDDQRRSLGLPPTRVRAVRRIIDSGALEVQAYDPVLFPGLEAQWGGRRPLVGGLTLALPPADDAGTAGWLAAGPPPVYVGFGSMPIERSEAVIGGIVAACRALDLRVLVSSPAPALRGWGSSDAVHVAQAVDHARVFPRCRAIIHHGGAGTTMASLRSGVPTFVLWVGADQPVWAAQVRRLGVGAARRLSRATSATLRADLRAVLDPVTAERARAVAAAMIPPERSAAATADLLERHAATWSGGDAARPPRRVRG